MLRTINHLSSLTRIWNIQTLRLLSSDNISIDHRRTQFKTCQKVYSDPVNRSKSMFKHCPPDGLELRVEYIDTKPDDSQSPRILLLHGAPGSYRDFNDLIIGFKAKGYRALAPNYPDIKFTDETNTFRHTTDEKAEFLSDFLKNIKVDFVHVAVTHSSVIYPCLEFWKQDPTVIKSFLMLNPAGHRIMKAMKPEYVSNTLSRINLNPVGRKIFKKIGRLLFHLMGANVQEDNADQLVTAMLTMYLADVRRLVNYLQLIREQRTPASYFMAQKDRLVEREIFFEMAKLLGVDESNIIPVLDGEDVRPMAHDEKEPIRAFNVVNGGHYAYKNQTKLIDQEVSRLLSLIK